MPELKGPKLEVRRSGAGGQRSGAAGLTSGGGGFQNAAWRVSVGVRVLKTHHWRETVRVWPALGGARLFRGNVFCGVFPQQDGGAQRHPFRYEAFRRRRRSPVRRSALVGHIAECAGPSVVVSLLGLYFEMAVLGFYDRFHRSPRVALPASSLPSVRGMLY